MSFSRLSRYVSFIDSGPNRRSRSGENETDTEVERARKRVKLTEEEEEEEGKLPEVAMREGSDLLDIVLEFFYYDLENNGNYARDVLAQNHGNNPSFVRIAHFVNKFDLPDGKLALYLAIPYVTRASRVPHR